MEQQNKNLGPVSYVNGSNFKGLLNFAHFKMILTPDHEIY